MSVNDPTSSGACDGIAIVDTVLNYQGSFSGISYYWSPGGPLGLGQNIKSDLCNACYYLTLNDEAGCSIVVPLTIGSAGTGNANLHESINVFPNPAIGFVTIHAGAPLNEILIFDTSGKILLAVQGNGETEMMVDVQFLTAGFYMVGVKSGSDITVNPLVVAN
jgi:hypothetical protein